MVELRRTVRLILGDPAAGDAVSGSGYSGTPALAGVVALHEVLVRCQGELDPSTGYLVDIKDVDRAVRRAAQPIIQHAFAHAPRTPPPGLLPGIFDAITRELRVHVAGVIWRLTPYTSFEMESTSRHVALLRHMFDFSASHRLHVPTMTDGENREVFGKCNNPSGHGHNYRLEVCLEVSTGVGAAAPTVGQVERLTHEAVISRFDHKHLNIDTPEFGPQGVIPSVENIARVCFELLDAALRRDLSGCRLREVTVWETDRTGSTFPAR